MMHNPIINPWFFYMADTMDSCKFVCEVLAACLVIFMVCAALILWLDDGYYFSKDKRPSFKPFIVTTIIMLILAVFIPSKTTVYKMEAAKLVTHETVEKSLDYIDHIVDRFIEKGK